MARIDALYLEDPCSGSHRMVDYLARDVIPISRGRVRNLMRRMSLRAIYQKPRTTVPGEPSERFPCLVDLKQVSRVIQAWASYIPLQKGSSTWWRSWIASPDMCSAGGCPTASTQSSVWMPWRCRSLTAASQRSFTPTRDASLRPLTLWPDCVQRASGSASWSVRKRCYDNIMVKRLWRIVIYEEVYLHAYSDEWEAEISQA